MIRAYIVPFSEQSLNNIFFDPSSGELISSPIMSYTKDYLRQNGIDLNTYDFWSPQKADPKDVLIVFDHPPIGFWKLAYAARGILGKSPFKRKARELPGLLKAFPKKILFNWESPVNMPWLYKKARLLTGLYDKIYSIPKLSGWKHFYYPQRNDKLKEDLFVRKRDKFLNMMNSFKRAKGYFRNNLYSERGRAAEFFSRYSEIDLFGERWGKYSKDLVKKVYRGYVDDKFDTLSRYNFSICFENAIWPGYTSEKIFECLAVGTIPVYLGNPEILDEVPKECFIDMRNFNNYGELRNFLHSLKNEDLENYRSAARNYLGSSMFKKFTKQYFAETFLEAIVE